MLAGLKCRLHSLNPGGLIGVSTVHPAARTASHICSSQSRRASRTYSGSSSSGKTSVASSSALRTSNIIARRVSAFCVVAVDSEHEGSEGGERDTEAEERRRELADGVHVRDGGEEGQKNASSSPWIVTRLQTGGGGGYHVCVTGAMQVAAGGEEVAREREVARGGPEPGRLGCDALGRVVNQTFWTYDPGDR
ncbi:hypothetical protein EVJ58_g2575 [Rhodofomes roseus]|uniref:Uncharacterized protein n=1 Tax=Rhodofomes roseus TaxID=34475 RepID=A0A4Y9YQU7_9APHY|nr:hypothetical protein EVJ58_g2575 [Rhodofomes roseus]